MISCVYTKVPKTLTPKKCQTKKYTSETEK